MASFARRLASALVVLVCLMLAPIATAQTVPVGRGSYQLTRPFGAAGPQNASGQSIAPKVTAGFAQRVQSNDWWSSLIFPFGGGAYTSILYAHPVTARATASGMEIGGTGAVQFVANDHLFPFTPGLTVGAAGLAPTRAAAAAYGDWTVMAAWEGGPVAVWATLGHGLPYVQFRIVGGAATVALAGGATVWHDTGGVLGITHQGTHYGVFAPTGAVWTGTTTRRSTLNGKDYLSVAVLPDASAATLALFRRHAYAFVTDSRVSWAYDEASARVTSTYAYTTVALETGGDLSAQTLTALYRHQWLDSPTPQTGHTYRSPRGEMRLVAGNAFTTVRAFTGVLPSLPNRGDYPPATLRALVEAAATESIGIGPTYENGKAMGRFAHLVHIADQIGATAARDHFLAQIKAALQDWLVAGGARTYVYDHAWDALTGYPSGYGADTQLNDHHFHASYAIWSAATVAQYDPAWAAPDAWGGMVDMLIRNANGWDRTDPLFPFLRTFDPYAGHSWAAGHGDFAEGNNQESSSESMHFASAVVLWGEATGRTHLRDLGVYLHTTEAAAVDQYWFDVDNAVFPSGYPHVAIGMVWGGKGVHATWFGADPEFIHGINLLPLTGGSMYLGRHPQYVVSNYNEIVAERNGPPVVWKDVLWQYLAFGDPRRALQAYYADEAYEPFDGESRAHTLHWLHNLAKMGRIASDITANLPTYAVFRDAAGTLTYVAHNAGAAARTVRFSDGYTMTVGPRALHSETTSPANPNAPVVRLLADRTSGKAPLTVAFDASRSFDPNGGPVTFAWNFRDGRTSTEAAPRVVFQTLGTRFVTLAVTDAEGLVARDSVQIQVVGNGTPYRGTAPTVPGTIEAENYDVGGEGVAYHDAEASNIGLAYRPAEGVDLEGGSGSNNVDVYWITDGEWIEWTFRVAEAGTFTLTPYVATVPGFGTLRLLVDNVDVSGARSVRGTGGWQNWTPVEVRDVTLAAGTHILRMEASSASDPRGWLFSLDRIVVARQGGTAADADAPAAPLALRAPWPNPSSERVTLAFALGTAGHVTLDVFDGLGRLVATPVDGLRLAGEHTVDLDLSGLASGVYVVRVRTPQAVARQSLVRR